MNTSTSRDAHRYFLSLAALVHSFSAGSQSQAALLKLEAAFHKYRPLLATILAQDAPKNPTERAQVEKGKAILFGEENTLPTAFSQQALLLSDLLDISEYRACEFLQQGFESQSRLGRTAFESAMHSYHQYKMDQLRLVQSLVDESFSDDLPEVGKALLQKMLKVALHGDSTSSSSSSSSSSSLKPSSSSSSSSSPNSLVARLVTILDTLKKKIQTMTDSGELLTKLRALCAAINADFDEILELNRKGHLTIRQEIGVTLLHLSANNLVTYENSVQILKSLQSADLSDLLTLYLTTTLFGSLKVYSEARFAAEEADPTGKASSSSASMTKSQFMETFNAALTSPSWTNMALKSAILLAWMAVVETSTISSTTWTPDQIAKSKEAALQGGAFQFFMDYMLAFVEGKDNGLINSSLMLGAGNGKSGKLGGVAGGGKGDSGSIADFGKSANSTADEQLLRDAIFALLDDMVTKFIARNFMYIRQLKDHESDRQTSPSKVGLRGMGFGAQAQPVQPPVQSTQPTKRHFEALLRLMASLYKDRPDAALKFWTDSPFTGFVKIATDTTQPHLISACYEMIASIATGPLSARRAAEFLQAQSTATTGTASGTSRSAQKYVSWQFLFHVLHTYGRQELHRPGIPPRIPTEDLLVMLSSLRCVRQIVKYCPVTRATLAMHPQYRALQNLLELVLVSVPLQLKAALFETVAAFCIKSPVGSNSANGSGDGSSGAPGAYDENIAAEVWAFLTKCDLLPILRKPGGGMSMMTSAGGKQILLAESGGIINDLESAETSEETYPETLAFLYLLNVLLLGGGGSGRLSVMSLRGGFLNTAALSASSGQQVSWAPFIEYVIDRVLIKAPGRNYFDSNEKWRVIEGCLRVLETSLSLFDVQPFLVELDNMLTMAAKNMPTASMDLSAVLCHPGFEVMTRLLTGSKLLDLIQEMIELGMEVVNTTAFTQMPYFAKCITKSLRIVRRCLEVQEQFLNVLVPHLMESRVIADDVSLPYMARLEQHLLVRPRVVTALGVLVESIVHLEIPVLSTQIISMLSVSPYFMSGGGGADGITMNRLVQLLASSSESERIRLAFVNKLAMEDPNPIVEDSLKSKEQAGVDGQDETIREMFDEQTKEMVYETPFGAYWACSSSSSSANEKIYSVDGQQPGLVSKLRLSIVKLLLKNLSTVRPVPNLAHFLLGFDVTKSVPLSRTVLEDPTVTGQGMGCLHVILDLVRSNVRQVVPNRQGDGENVDESSMLDIVAVNEEEETMFVQQSFALTEPELSELSYRLLYTLCSDRMTSKPVMRYLRSKEDFFYRQLDGVLSLLNSRVMTNFVQNVTSIDDARTLRFAWQQVCWVLKMAGLELHLASVQERPSEVRKILRLLFGDVEDFRRVDFGNDILESEEFDQVAAEKKAAGAGAGGKGSESFWSTNNGGEKSSSAGRFTKDSIGQPLMNVLETLDNLYREPSWTAFEDLAAPIAMNQTEYFSAIPFGDMRIQGEMEGSVVYDVRRIRDAMLAMISQADRQGLLNDAASRAKAFEEMKSILVYLVHMNAGNEYLSSRLKALRSWCEIVEITMRKGFYDALPGNRREMMVVQLVAAVLPKIEGGISYGEEFGGLAMTLMSRLKESRKFQETLFGASGLSSSSAASSAFMRNVGSSGAVEKLPIEVLRTVLVLLMRAIISPGVTHKTRGYLYVSLLNYLAYSGFDELEKAQFKAGQMMDDGYSVGGARGYGGLVGSGSSSSVSTYRVNLVFTNLKVISEYMGRLIEMVGRDATDGVVLWRMVAFSVLESLYTLARNEKHNKVLSSLGSHGYVTYFVEKLRHADNEEVKASLKPDAVDSMPVSLFTFASKLQLLLSMSFHREGVEKLVNHQVFEALNEMSFLECRPEVDLSMVDFELPTKSLPVRYHEALLPVLELVLSLIMSVGKSNPTIMAKASSFVEAHDQMFGSILNERAGMTTSFSLKELRLSTGILSSLASNKALRERKIGSAGNHSFHSLMMSLFQRYCSYDRWLNRVTPVLEVEAETDNILSLPAGRTSAISVFRKNMNAVIQDVCFNLLTYYETVSAPSSIDGRIRPVFSYPMATPKSMGKASMEIPTLGSLIAFVRDIAMLLIESVDEYSMLRSMSQDVSKVPYETLKEYAGMEGLPFESLSDIQILQLASRQLHLQSLSSSKSIRRLLDTIECALTLTWRHLTYYLQQYKPSSHFMDSTMEIENTSMLSASVSTWASRSVLGGGASMTAQRDGSSPFTPTVSELESLQMDAKVAVLPVLDRLVQLDMASVFGENGETRMSFMNMLMRRLGDLLA